MTILKTAITIAELKKLSLDGFGDMLKAVVDVDRELLAINAELHSDLEALLLKDGAKQNSLWGINLYPSLSGNDFIEFDSMINLRPSQGNASRGVENPMIREKIVAIVNRWVTR